MICVKLLLSFNFSINSYGPTYGRNNTKSINMYSYNFTGLPDDTVFRITIIGSSQVVNTDPVATSVTAMILNGR